MLAEIRGRTFPSADEGADVTFCVVFRGASSLEL